MTEDERLTYSKLQITASLPETYLFIILVKKTLAIAIRENEKIYRIEIGNKAQNRPQYADGTSLPHIFAMNPSTPHWIFFKVWEKAQVS